MVDPGRPGSPPLVEQAFRALGSGRAGEARRLFEAAVADRPGEAAVWLGLAFSCANLGDGEAALRAVDRALVLEPRDLRALLFKGDQLLNGGESGRSLAFYERALAVAADLDGQLPADIRQGLERARAVSARYTREYTDFLMDGLGARGYRPQHASSRFNLSLDICLGRKQIYYQEPSRYYFPGLPQRQFYERGEFPWLAEIEAATGAIREELKAVLADAGSFEPYLQSHMGASGSDAASRGIMDNPDWGAFYLWEYGSLVQANVSRCPATTQALESAPLPFVRDQLPIVLFSRLAAGTRIPPHHGMLNTRLICHLPLIVPEDCGALRCGSEQRPWVEGETLIFDDSIEHEAWNNSDRERVVLLFDIWRPELTPDERELVTGVLEVVREYQDRQRS